MKSYKSDSSPVPAIVGGLSAIGLSLFWGPVGLAVFPLIYGLQKHANTKNLDNIVDEEAIFNLADEWKFKRKDENLEVSTTTYAGFHLPIKRTYYFKKDEDDRDNSK